MCFRFFKCCKKKPVEQTATPDNTPRRIEVSVARLTAPAHRYTDTVTNIMETLELRK